MSGLQVIDTLTITDANGKILSTVPKESPEGRVIKAMMERLAEWERLHQDHDGSPGPSPEATPVNPENYYEVHRK